MLSQKRRTGALVALVVVAVVSLTAQDCRITSYECPQLLPVFSADADPADSVAIGCPYRYVDENGDTTTVGGVDIGG